MTVRIEVPLEAQAGGDGLLEREGSRLFPLGFYELPKEDAELQRMAQAGVNLVRCAGPTDLDRAHAAGMLGWLPLPLHEGPTNALREAVEATRNHPALAAWEGPDEIVWIFTAYSGLEKEVGIRRADWWGQTTKAVEYSETQARRIMPNLRDAIRLVRELDDKRCQVWINEARHSDPKFVRQYLDYVDITGCDHYALSGKYGRQIASIGKTVELWKQIGRGKPVWQVLMAFSYSAVEGAKDPLARMGYPSFAESRFMAYDVIAHGAKGVLYWGSVWKPPTMTTERGGELDPEFRSSLYALTSELAALQPFLVAPEESQPKVNLIEAADEGRPRRGVKLTVRRDRRDWLIVLVNEDDHRHMGAEVVGLDAGNGLRLDLLYGEETVTVERGSFITRMQPYEVKVFATGRRWETAMREGRDFHHDACEVAARRRADSG